MQGFSFSLRLRARSVVLLLLAMLPVCPGCSYYIVRDGRVDQERVAKIKSRVEQVRGLEFTREVEVALIDEKQLKSYLEGEVEASFPKDTFSHLESASVRLGLLPQGVNLRQDCTELFMRQVSGFYNFRTGELYLTPLAYRRSFWVKLVEFLKQRDLVGEYLVAHELTHALQDQHFNLHQTYERAYLRFDQALAVAALVEGDAILVSLEVLFSHLKPGRFQDSEYRAKVIRRITANIRESGKRQAELREAPPFVRQVALFPYAYGLDFIAKLHLLGGWEAVNKALKDPPESTEQVLHPEKFLPPRDHPREPTIREMLAPETWRLLAGNTVGELGVRSLFEQYLSPGDAKRIAAGWGGDLFQLYEHKQEAKLAVVWATAWDTEEDARQFADGLKRAFLLAFPELGSWRHTAGEAGPDPAARLEADSPGQQVEISAAGDQVEVFIVSTSDLTRSIMGAP